MTNLPSNPQPQYSTQPSVYPGTPQQPAFPGSTHQSAPQSAQQPAYPNSYAQPGYTKPVPTNTTVADTNTYALVSILLAFLMPLAGIIFGHLALGQIKRTGDSGRGLALTALIYGYCVLTLWALFFILYIGFFALMFSAIASNV